MPANTTTLILKKFHEEQSQTVLAIWIATLTSRACTKTAALVKRATADAAF